MSHLLGISVFAMISYVRLGLREFFYKGNNLEKKCLLPELTVFSIKGVVATLVIFLNY